ncbi:DEAD/DEAH box helicase [Pelagicoccus sp. SDUM812003]|uniref:DEAD/DEAH box helicase n=1 Tax=Pelagicoccus sp. SDUM812003 TaxID=3041267 RepID=UPI00280D3836|nr:DEAD/DEAH box helicase [Pelagicoccus sp. SDUM812003]MDQ8202341.1 DEAD/DEAH box helicase [Pelagicoccus sp. SDUM812003]
MPENAANSWKNDLENSLGRSFTANERQQLQAISELFEDLEWRDSLYPKDLEVFAEDIKLKVPDPSKSISVNLWQSKPQSERQLLQYIGFLLEQYECPIPDFLSGAINTAPIKMELLKRAQEKETRLWKNRLGNLSQRRIAQQTPRLEIRLKLQGRSLKWEGRTETQSEFSQITAKDFGQWLSKDYGFLERFEPNSITLAALFQEYFKSTQRARIDLEKDEDCAFLNKLLHHPVAKNQILNRNDEPLAISENSLRWTGVENGVDSDGCYRIRLILDNEEPAPEPMVFLPGENPLYLANETLYHGPPLLRPGENPSGAFRIPAPALEAPEGLLFLRNHGLPLPESIGEDLVCLPMQAILDCRVRADDNEWSKKTYLDCRLYSVSPDQRYWFLLAEDGWIPTERPETKDANPTPPEGTLFEHPPTTYVQDLLEPFNLAEEEDEGIWSREVDAGFAREFIEWIQRLPSEIQLVPDEELDTLVDGRPAGRYSLSIDNEANSDWFNVKLDPEFLDTDLTEAERKLVMRANGSFTYLPGKGWKRFESDVTGKNKDLLDTLGIQFDETRSGQHALHALQLADSKLEDTAFDELRESIRKRAKELSAKTPVNIPKGIRSELRPYQVEGFKFLAYLARNRFGGILADDMGLGKTLQTLTWLTWLKLNRPAEEPFLCLVVCPKSVMHVWQKEVEIHSSELSITLFDPEKAFPSALQVSGTDIMVANYSQLRIHKAYFTKEKWTVAILDEAQYIKNPLSQTARCARELNAEYRIALTGTPVENRATDLWSIFSYAMPGLLGSRAAFAKQYKENDPQTPARLANRVKHFMIRRSKKQVATDLPDRIEESLVCQMEGEQRDLYLAELKMAQQKVLGLDKSAFDKERFNILSSLLRMRQICCHPGLISEEYANVRSAKLEALIDHVSELQDEGHKVLIFSQFVEMLKIIGRELGQTNCKYLTLTGQTKNREELVDQFQNDDSITAFLLSLRAAGSGLNLTAASYVILYDPWWNPAVEAQAIDRTHRIGQKNTVNAYRLIAKDSVEQKIQSLQFKKESLANEIVREESLTQILDLDNLKYVLSE